MRLRLCLTFILVNLIFSQLGAAPEPAVAGTRAEFEGDRPTQAEPIYLPLIQRRSPQNSIFGIEHWSFNDLYAVDMIQATGSRYVRRNIALWPLVEPSPGQRNWSNPSVVSFENELKTLSQRGLQVILMLRESPVWALTYPQYSCSPVEQDAMDELASFLHDLVARYSKPPFNVKMYELWNEPEVKIQQIDAPLGCWGMEKDYYYGGGYYGNMLKTVYPYMKAADRSSMVLVGGLLLDCNSDNPPPGYNCAPSRYLEGILASGAGASFDGVSFHSYDLYLQNNQYGNGGWQTSSSNGETSTAAKTAFIRKVLAKYGAGDKLLLNTETALMCYSTCDSGFETTKANRLVVDYVTSIAVGLQVNIWYDLYGAWRDTGLLDTAYYPAPPLPAYHAFTFANQKIGAADFVKEASWSVARAYQFHLPGKFILVAWSRDGSPHPITFEQPPTMVFDINGNIVTFNNPFILTASPVYFEWNE